MKTIFSKLFPSHSLMNVMTIDHAANNTRGGSGNATEFGRPQGRNK